MRKLTVVYSLSIMNFVSNSLLNHVIDKEILDGIQIAKDIERSLYYYPQGELREFAYHVAV